MKHDGEGNGFRVSDFQSRDIPKVTVSEIEELLTPDPWGNAERMESASRKECDCGTPGGYHLPDCEIMR